MTTPNALWLIAGVNFGAAMVAFFHFINPHPMRPGIILFNLLVAITAAFVAWNWKR